MEDGIVNASEANFNGVGETPMKSTAVSATTASSFVLWMAQHLLDSDPFFGDWIRIMERARMIRVKWKEEEMLINLITKKSITEKYMDIAIHHIKNQSKPTFTLGAIIVVLSWILIGIIVAFLM